VPTPLDEPYDNNHAGPNALAKLYELRQTNQGIADLARAIEEVGELAASHEDANDLTPEDSHRA
jgi:hypothetical protein